MKIKNYHFSKGFIQALLLIIFMTWLVFKCVPLTEKEQNAKINSKMERQRLKLAQELDRYTPEEQARLPEFNYRKYSLIKRNARFWLIPREYGGGVNCFGIEWPADVNKLLKKIGKMILMGSLLLLFSCILLNTMEILRIIGVEKFIVIHPVRKIRI